MWSTTRFTSFSFQVNKALCILYSRHVVSRLLAEWPEDRELTSEVLDSGDEVQLIGILDLLQRIETKENFEKVGKEEILLEMLYTT